MTAYYLLISMNNGEFVEEDFDDHRKAEKRAEKLKKSRVQVVDVCIRPSGKSLTTWVRGMSSSK